MYSMCASITSVFAASSTDGFHSVRVGAVVAMANRSRVRFGVVFCTLMSFVSGCGGGGGVAPGVAVTPTITLTLRVTDFTNDNKPSKIRVLQKSVGPIEDPIVWTEIDVKDINSDMGGSAQTPYWTCSLATPVTLTTGETYQFIVSNEATMVLWQSSSEADPYNGAATFNLNMGENDL